MFASLCSLSFFFGSMHNSQTNFRHSLNILKHILLLLCTAAKALYSSHIENEITFVGLLLLNFFARDDLASISYCNFAVSVACCFSFFFFFAGVGPFLDALLRTLENMLDNSIHINLQTTSALAAVASYSQPLIAHYLFDQHMSLQPGVKNLYKVIFCSYTLLLCG